MRHILVATFSFTLSLIATCALVVDRQLPDIGGGDDLPPVIQCLEDNGFNFTACGVEAPTAPSS